MFNPPVEYYAYTGLINAIVSLAISALILLKRNELWHARLYGYFSALVGLWSFFYFLWLRVTQNAALADFLVRTCMVFVMFFPPVFWHFASEWTGRLKNRTLRISNYLLTVLLLTTIYTPLFSPGVVQNLVFPFWPLPGPTFFVHLVQISTSVIGGMWLVGASAYESTGRFRLQLLWTFWAFVIGWLSGFSNYLLWLRFPIPPILNAFVSLYVMVIAYAIVKHQLLDIRIILRRSLVYSLLIACITAAYLVMVLITERWFQGFFGYRSFIATVVVAFLIAIFFNPLRDRIQAFVDRALFSATPAELATQREQLLVEVRKTEQMKAVATLAAGLAHEIKNPLSAIKTFTEHLNTKYPDPAFRAKFQKIVGGEVERIHLIVQQLLEFAKPVPPKLMPMEVSQLVDETLEFLNNDLVTRHIEVQRRYETTEHVLADPQQLKQVFLNLFLNSLQAMNGRGRLEIRTGIDNSDLTVAITDDGSGIDPKDLPHVFEPFFTTKATGTGLGLAVVQSIIKEHGGRIHVESHPGQGTTMTLSLPIAV